MDYTRCPQASTIRSTDAACHGAGRTVTRMRFPEVGPGHPKGRGVRFFLGEAAQTSRCRRQDPEGGPKRRRRFPARGGPSGLHSAATARRRAPGLACEPGIGRRCNPATGQPPQAEPYGRPPAPCNRAASTQRHRRRTRSHRPPGRPLSPMSQTQPCS
jgi:hypothetical protein